MRRNRMMMIGAVVMKGKKTIASGLRVNPKECTVAERRSPAMLVLVVPSRVLLLGVFASQVGRLDPLWWFAPS
jgi:hypothetical protein